MTYCGIDLDNTTIEDIVDEMGEVEVGCKDELESCCKLFLSLLHEKKFIVVKVGE